ncbi:hypothetical protein C4B63_20g345 [Trypanosoma cruzi]|uniref:Uncharacterized protein n=1 Tax=Trypanosoma cruzi TaxID=5693 RepID=A0A2V2VJN4_TRYCR|nr:hypothetical protein C4B63_20g345 [Trypanosoma cruzi]
MLSFCVAFLFFFFFLACRWGFPRRLAGSCAATGTGCGGGGEVRVGGAVEETCAAGAMSLRDDIEALTAALHRFSRLQECGSSSDARGKDVGRHLDRDGALAPQLSDVDISAISVTAEGDEHDDDILSAVTQQAPTMLLRSRKSFDDNSAVPPSSNTTALPSGDGSGSNRQRGRGTGFARVLVPQEKGMLKDPCTVVWESNGTCPESLSVAAEESAQRSSIVLNATATSGNSTACQDEPKNSLRQMEEAYKLILRKLLAEIRRLDAHTAVLSARCEGERENLKRVQRKHEKELVESNALIVALRQQLVGMCSGCEGALASGARVSSGSEWTLGNYGTRYSPTVLNRWSTKESRSGSGAGTTSGLHPHYRPVVSSELCGMSSSFTAETFSGQLPQRTSEEIDRGGSGASPMRQRVSGNDVTSTRPHSLTGFLQQRLSSSGTARVSEEVATQTSNPTMPATEATDSGRLVGILEDMPGRNSASPLGDVGRSNRGDAAHPVRCTTSEPTVCFFHENDGKRGLRVFTEANRREKRRNRRGRRAPATNASPRNRSRVWCSDEGFRQPPRGCSLCCREHRGAAARAVTAAGNCGMSTAAGAMVDCGTKGTRSASRLCPPVLAKTRRNNRNEKKHEIREMLRGIIDKNTALEGRLQIFQQRLDEQEMGLRDVIALLGDFMLTPAVESRKFCQTAGPP